MTLDGYTATLADMREKFPFSFALPPHFDMDDIPDIEALMGPCAVEIIMDPSVADVFHYHPENRWAAFGGFSFAKTERDAVLLKLAMR